MGFEKCWEAALENIKDEIGKDAFDCFLSEVSFEERRGMLILHAREIFQKDWIEKNLISGGLLTDILHNLSGKNFNIKVKMSPRYSDALPSDSISREISISKKRNQRDVSQKSPAVLADGSILNPLYSFERFVVGPSNNYAVAAAKAVTKISNSPYNPLFIYGGVGLGKTHLMQAIGHKIIEENPGTTVLYIFAEQFTNEFIAALANGKMDDFHKKYRDVEVLLIDDIQFLAKKDRSQEEFFHTFNVLYQSGKQIVISADSPPKELNDIEDRLRSRFSSGLSVDIKPPKYEMRVAILQRKAESADLDIPKQCLEFIAHQIHSNIRELEGALMKVAALAKFQQKSITLEFTREALRDFLPTVENRHIAIPEIQKAVAAYFRIPVSDLKGPKRSSNITLPRQIAIYLCRELTGHSLPVIGGEFGNRDHTTILYSCRKISQLVEDDRRIRSAISEIRSALSS